MIMTKPSPTPWIQGREYSNSQDEIEDAEGRTIAVVWTRKAPPGATARPQFQDAPRLKANMKLMIAAPRLLDALTQLLKFTESNLGRRGEKDLNMPILMNAREAIAAATPDGDPAPEPTKELTGNAELSKEVYETLYRATDSFEKIGMQVAYLVGGILTGSGLAYHGTLGETEAEFVELLRETFADSHPVWKMIDLTEVDSPAEEI